ncbi:MAG: hypothetical protein M0Q99_11735 [Candidatus Cloacimonetes bacterium]|nr:hypothetical protein [Candidatus Cloacimonadota bacterium]
MSRTLLISILLVLIMITASCAKRNTSYEDGNAAELIRTIPVVGNPTHISYGGDRLYVALDQGGMAVVNTTDYNMEMFTSLTSDDGSVTALNRIRFTDCVAEHDMLVIYDTYDTDNITFVNTANPDSLKPYARIIGESQNILDLSLRKLDNDPNGNIVELLYVLTDAIKYGRNDGGFWLGNETSIAVDVPIKGVDMDDDNFYVAVDQRGLFTYSRESTQLLSEIAFYGYAQKLAVNDKIAYIAARHGGLQIVDVSNPAQPVHLAEFDTDGYASDIAYKNGIVAVSSGGGGVYLFDVSNPAKPKLMDHITDCGYANTVTFVENTIVVASRDDGVLIYAID